MRRFIPVLLLSLLVSGCMSLSRPSGPTVEDRHGLVLVAATESYPPPPTLLDPPILEAIVRPANPLTSYEACQDFLDEPFARICAADWSRTVITPEEHESVSVTVMTGGEPTRFRIIFAGHRPGDVADGVAISREYVAPPYWSGELEFDVPIYPPFTRVFFLQIEWRAEDAWATSHQDIVFAPCPSDYPWDGCDLIAR